MFRGKSLQIIAVIGLASCQTAQKVAKVDQGRNEAMLYSTDDKRTAMPNPNEQKPLVHSVENLKAEIKRNPADIKSLLNLSQIRLMQGQYEEAESYARQALRHDLKNVE